MIIGVDVSWYDEYWEEKINKILNSYPNIEVKVFRKGDKKRYCDLDVLIIGKISNVNIDDATNLKAIFIPFTGINQIPHKLLKQRGIFLCNSHGKAEIVAERAIALTLAMLGNIVKHHNEMTNGIWFTRKYKDQYWNSLYKKRCGIIGMGHIGSKLTELLKAFDCEIYTLKRNTNHKLVDYYVDTLDELVENIDILYPCIPLSKHTQGLIDNKILQKMKNKFIVNISRGAVIDEEALYNSLEKNILAGAAIDVWYNYPKNTDHEGVYPSKYPFEKLDNIIMSPHAASHAKDNRYDYEEEMFNKLIEFIETKDVKDKVNFNKYI